MKTDQPLLLNEEQVRKHLRMADLIPAMEKALIDFSAGKVSQPVRSVIKVDPPGGFLGLMPAHTPDGLGLPAGRGSVAEGKKIYEAKCIACHGAEGKGGSVYGTMVGGIGSFKGSPRVLTPGSMYPYAPILFDYIRRSMPMDRPQTLTANEVYAVSAYLLNLNGLVPANAVMDAQSLAKVQMPNRDGFLIDDRPDSKAVRCMNDCK